MNFKEISLDDKIYIDSIFRQFPPYCDFSFLNLYSWRPNNNVTQIAKDKGNLIIKAGSLTSNNYEVSILGKNEVESTIDELIDSFYELSIVPEDVIKDCPNIFRKYQVIEDEDNRDYIASINDTVKLQGDKYNSKRNYINKFSKTPDLRVIVYKNPLPSSLPKEIEDLYESWLENKFETTEANKSEFNALESLIENANLYNLIYIFVYIGNKLEAFSISELAHNNYAVVSFAKTNIHHMGISEFLMHKTAVILSNMGYEYLNYEQDLGIENLRKYKLSWNPSHFLKKYTIKKL